MVEGSKIQREYPITPGRIEGLGRRGRPLTADYVLVYRNRKLAVTEAKAWDKPLTEGVAQAKDYAAKMAVRFAYAMPPVSRKERAAKATVEVSTRFNAKQRVFLDFVLSHYVSEGVRELDQEKLTPLLRLKYKNSIADALADLGRPEEIGKAFAEFQKYSIKISPQPERELLNRRLHRRSKITVRFFAWGTNHEDSGDGDLCECRGERSRSTTRHVLPGCAPDRSTALPELPSRGRSGPMPLGSYQETRPWARAIKQAVVARKMPPWNADGAPGRFHNDPSLTEREIDTLVSWADSDAPAGDPEDAPAPRVFTEGWSVGAPDVVFEMPAAYEVPVSGTIEYTYVIVPTGFKEDRWVTSAEVRPGNRAVVHHANVYVREPGSGWLREYPTGTSFVPTEHGQRFGLGGASSAGAQPAGAGHRRLHTGTARQTGAAGLWIADSRRVRPGVSAPLHDQRQGHRRPNADRFHFRKEPSCQADDSNPGQQRRVCDSARRVESPRLRISRARRRLRAHRRVSAYAPSRQVDDALSHLSDRPAGGAGARAAVRLQLAAGLRIQ